MARFEVLEITVSNVPNARELVLHLANEYSLVFECIDDRQFYTIRMYSVRLDQIDKVLQYRRVNYHLLVVSDDELHLTIQSINGNPVCQHNSQSQSEYGDTRVNKLTTTLDTLVVTNAI